MRLLCVLVVGWSLSACVVYQHEAWSNGGNHERDTYAALGGSASQHGADGSSLVHDHQASFKDGVQALGSYATAQAAGAVTKAVTESNNAAATTQAKNASDAATAQAKISADAAAKSGQQANFGKLIDAGTFAQGQSLPAGKGN